MRRKSNIESDCSLVLNCEIINGELVDSGYINVKGPFYVTVDFSESTGLDSFYSLKFLECSIYDTGYNTIAIELSHLKLHDSEDKYLINKYDHLSSLLNDIENVYPSFNSLTDMSDRSLTKNDIKYIDYSIDGKEG